MPVAVMACSNPGQTIKKCHQYDHNKNRTAIQSQQLRYCNFCKSSCNGPPLQLYFSDICNISGNGPRPLPHSCDVFEIDYDVRDLQQFYREPLAEQRCNREEAGPVPQRWRAPLRCELCAVTCSGPGPYNQHLRGAKHQKALILHGILGDHSSPHDPSGSGDGTTSRRKGGGGGGSVTITATEVASVKPQQTTPAATSAAVTADGNACQTYLAGNKHGVSRLSDCGITYFTAPNARTCWADKPKLHCELCAVTFSRPAHFEKHLRGAKHQKALNNIFADLRYIKKIIDMQVAVLIQEVGAGSTGKRQGAPRTAAKSKKKNPKKNKKKSKSKKTSADKKNQELLEDMEFDMETELLEMEYSEQLEYEDVLEADSMMAYDSIMEMQDRFLLHREHRSYKHEKKITRMQCISAPKTPLFARDSC
ncbi:zinc finger RNA-binding protein [Hyalella azteca]|uniref:Zinc finger RNA-binding protein n=1 Tax=Hyalella azteca TaxID=294128 RepID=A0A8B7N2M3_HYAAZ|nr:zinc finger RNA-binding protein [Hyalella azteca]XP_047738955.1 zinc finger RNA-binding protein [Hyalella azteca]XP_047738956.1 zinc finger RNA-binding protein [Hyalella azteca]